MRKARYHFDPKKEYLARVASVIQKTYPSVNRFITLLKVILATPLIRLKKEDIWSNDLEAVVWLNPEVDKDLFPVMGIICKGKIFNRVNNPPWISCMFKKSTGESGYQDLLICKPIDINRWPQLGQFGVPTSSSGLVLDGNQFIWKGRVIKLSNTKFRLLEALNQYYPSPVSMEDLKQLVWDNSVEDRTVEVTINQLKKDLGPIGFLISTRDGDRGWALIRSL